MIFVTVGNLPFDRLVRAADDLASLGDEPVIIQRGSGSYLPSFAEHVEFVDETQIQEWLSQARVVIAHSGAGTILGVLAAGKPLVLAPRMARLGEHIDDHQFELAEALVSQGRAVMVTDLSAEILSRAIARAPQKKGEQSGETSLHAFLRAWLAGEAMQPPSRWRRLFRRR